MCLPLLGTSALFRQIGLGPVGITVHAVILESVRRIEDPLNRLDAVPFLAFRNVIAGKTEIIENAVGVCPLPE